MRLYTRKDAARINRTPKPVTCNTADTCVFYSAFKTDGKFFFTFDSIIDNIYLYPYIPFFEYFWDQLTGYSNVRKAYVWNEFYFGVQKERQDTSTL